MNLVFGPVPSRRLGLSLGVDLVPLKTCTYDCVYCQLGPTAATSAERREWVPLDQLQAELEQKLSHPAARPDYITLSGSGEPTLHIGIGRLIRWIKSVTEIPVAVLTNGSLLWQEPVRRDLFAADLVVPSLDAGCQETYLRVNRPAPGIEFQQMAQGLADFRQEFSGQYWLEILLLQGLNDSEAEMERLVRWAGRIRPDRIQLNSVTRPPACDSAVAVTAERLAELAARFKPSAEVIARCPVVEKAAGGRADAEEILAVLRRRPCSVDDLVVGLGLHRLELKKQLKQLTSQGLLEETAEGGVLFYKPKP